MSAINLQCGERCELHGVSLRFLCRRNDGSIELLVQRAGDLDEPLRELQADNQFLRESLQAYENGLIPSSEREASLERKCEAMAHELARLTAKLEKHRVERITEDPYQNPEAWEAVPVDVCYVCKGQGCRLCKALGEGEAPVTVSENCPQCGRYSGGKNPCHKCRSEVMQ